MKKFALSLGIDRAVFFSLLSRVWNVGAGLITLAVISHFLSPEVQGYYYTFNSLIALQVFAELGLNFAIVQFASHEMAHLTWQENGTVAGSPQSKRRLQSLVQFAMVWLGVAALLMIIFLLPTGLYFFSTSNASSVPRSGVAVPWLALVILSAVNLFIGTASAILEGCGRISQVAVMRLWQSIFAATIVWFTLSRGGGLYALPASSLTMALIGFSWLWINYRLFFTDLLVHRDSGLGMSWRKEIWPFQWRIALSWASGYFIFQIFNPLLFRTQGPIAAGQMGMTMQIFGAMNGAAIVWMSTKAPVYGQLIATGQRKILDTLFRKTLIESALFLLAGIIAIWTALYYLNSINSPYAERVLPLNYFSFLCLVSLANHIVFSEAIFLRAHKEEPFLIISIANGLLTLVLAFWLIPSIGTYGAILAYGIPALVVSLIGGSIIFYKKKKKFFYE